MALASAGALKWRVRMAFATAGMTPEGSRNDAIRDEERVDALVGITEQNHAAPRSDELEELLLRVAGVLKLINNHQPPARAKVIRNNRRRPCDLERQRQKTPIADLVRRQA